VTSLLSLEMERKNDLQIEPLETHRFRN
jgi:hypothetical protein